MSSNYLLGFLIFVGVLALIGGGELPICLVNAVFVAKMRLLGRNSADSSDLRPAACRFLTRC